MIIDRNENEEPMPWERQCGESVKSFGFFKLYLELGRSRTLNQVAQISSLSYRTIAGYSSRNEWLNRADKYDLWKIDEKLELMKTDFDKKSIDQFHQNIDFVDIINSLLDYIIPCLDNFSDKYTDPEIQKKVKYINFIVNTIIELKKASNFTLSSNLINIMMDKDFKNLRVIEQRRLKKETGASSDIIQKEIFNKLNSLILQLKPKVGSG